MKRAQSGFTLIELLISLGVVLIGMLGLYKVLSVATRGSQSAARFTQAQARAAQIHEAIRTAPKQTLDCLVINPATSWASCEAQCKVLLGALASPQACVFSTLSVTGQDKDGTQQRYAVVVDGSDPNRTTRVLATGLSGRVYDVQVAIGWNDEGGATNPTHRLVFRSAVFR